MSSANLEQTYLKTEGAEPSEVPDGYVVYQAGRDMVHYLNPTAVIVYELCDGAHTGLDMARYIAELYELGAPPTDEVSACLATLQEQQLIRPAAP
jgi:hypothetical protein